MSFGKKAVEDATETDVNEKIKGLSSKCFPGTISQKNLNRKKGLNVFC